MADIAGVDLGSVKEHADVLAALGIAYFLWTAKRTLNKQEEAITGLVETLNEVDEKNERRITDVYSLLNEVRTERDAQVGGINTRLATLEGEHRARHAPGGMNGGA